MKWMQWKITNVIFSVACLGPWSSLQPGGDSLPPSEGEQDGDRRNARKKKRNIGHLIKEPVAKQSHVNQVITLSGCFLHSSSSAFHITRTKTGKRRSPSPPLAPRKYSLYYGSKHVCYTMEERIWCRGYKRETHIFLPGEFGEEDERYVGREISPGAIKAPVLLTAYRAAISGEK